MSMKICFDNLFPARSCIQLFLICFSYRFSSYYSSFAVYITIYVTDTDLGDIVILPCLPAQQPNLEPQEH